MEDQQPNTDPAVYPQLNENILGKKQGNVLISIALKTNWIWSMTMHWKI